MDAFNQAISILSRNEDDDEAEEKIREVYKEI